VAAAGAESAVYDYLVYQSDAMLYSCISYGGRPSVTNRYCIETDALAQKLPPKITAIPSPRILSQTLDLKNLASASRPLSTKFDGRRSPAVCYTDRPRLFTTRCRQRSASQGFVCVCNNGLVSCNYAVNAGRVGSTIIHLCTTAGWVRLVQQY